MSTYDVKKQPDGKYAAMRFDFWLIFDEDGSMRMTRKQPSVKRTERAMFLQVTLPKRLWATPELKATFEIPSPDDAPTVIDVDVANAALRSALGVDIDLVVTTRGDQS